jgi:hypothetical protein
MVPAPAPQARRPDDQAHGGNDAIVGSEHCSSQPPDAGDKVILRELAKTTHPASRLSDPPKQHKNDNNDQDGTEDTDATVAVAVTIAAEATTESPEQENDEDDNEDSSERHGSSLLGSD